MVKKCAAVMVLLLLLSTNLFAAPIDTVEVDQDGYTVISGDFGLENANKKVTIHLLQEGVEFDQLELSEIDSIDLVNFTNHVYQVYTDADGKYSHKFILKGKTGQYTVRVGGIDQHATGDFTFNHYDVQEINEIFEQLNAAKESKNLETMRGIFADPINREMLNIDFTFDQAAFNKLPALLFTSIANVSEDLNENNIAQYFTAVEALIDIYSLSHYSGFTALLSKYDTIFSGLKLAVYNNLKNPNMVDTAVSGKAFESISAFTTAFNSAVDDQQKAENNPKPISSGGGSTGGSSGSGFAHAPVETVTEQTAQPQPSAQPTAPPPKQFDDIADVPWASQAIEALTLKGVIKGVGENIFAPMDNITREQAVKILVEAFGLLDNTAQSDFNDVDATQWYYPFIATAQELGLVNGISATEFGVGSLVTRQDLVVMVHRTAMFCKVVFEELKPLEEFSDQQYIDDYAKESISIIQKANIIGGMGDGRFAPQDFCTRAQGAKIVYELLKVANRID